MVDKYIYTHKESHLLRNGLVVSIMLMDLVFVFEFEFCIVVSMIFMYCLQISRVATEQNRLKNFQIFCYGIEAK